ncbi:MULTISPECIES: DMT family transporter [unclassified Agarivorans]|uniref:DMT family transporter n=1 Tax=unclassified Agarivorans TaxID=2636026 RepID=UPI0026E3DF56|nr:MULTISPECIES: DMT family transporter [unclassified Agarivorans]MDO6685676.1 DMT family transporter [Agarivorans sp. 3_MG-2023]MDO6716209.1 DMT family transporter [Agarivorans sp. 2_MG-2023]
MNYEWLALLAAALWACTSLISVTPSRQLGAFAYSRWRMGLVSVMLLSAALFNNQWQVITLEQAALFALSGFIGVFVGDTALFACMNRLGPRRASLLFACHAAFSAFLGVWLFNEALFGWSLLGAGCLFLGVALAVAFGRKPDQHSWEKISGPVGIAVALGLTAALCQSLGTVMLKPLMSAPEFSEIDPVAGSALRMFSAFSAHWLLWLSGNKLARAQNPLNSRLFMMIAANGFLAMAVGMTLMLFALRYGDVSVVALLSSTSPVLVLPLLWIVTKQAPTRSAWCSAALCVLGSALLIFA